MKGNQTTPPRLIRFRDAPGYLGMNRAAFNELVRPFVTEAPLWKQGILFNTLELDAWADEYTYVFTYRGHRVGRINNSGWRNAKKKAGLSEICEHDLKHTCGRRLRAAGVSQETRKVLLGHKNGDITTHYSAPEIKDLIDAAETICGNNSRETPELTLLKVRRIS